MVGQGRGSGARGRGRGICSIRQPKSKKFFLPLIELGQTITSNRWKERHSGPRQTHLSVVAPSIVAQTRMSLSVVVIIRVYLHVRGFNSDSCVPENDTHSSRAEVWMKMAEGSKPRKYSLSYFLLASAFGAPTSCRFQGRIHRPVSGVHAEDELVCILGEAVGKIGVEGKEF